MVKPRIAIVGLGLIGGSLARRLVNAGCEVTAWNHNDRPYATAEADGIARNDLAGLDSRTYEIEIPLQRPGIGHMVFERGMTH